MGKGFHEELDGERVTGRTGWGKGYRENWMGKGFHGELDVERVPWRTGCGKGYR